MAEHDEVRLGMRVRDVHGDVLGTVVRLGAGRFLVQRGNVVKESVIVPDRCVAAVNAGEIVLSCGHRELIDAMHNPPMDEERERTQQYRYAEIQAEREEREANRKAAAGTQRTGAESLAEHPGKVRVVREEIAVNPGSAHEYQVRGTDEEEREVEKESNDPDNPVH